MRPIMGRSPTPCSTCAASWKRWLRKSLRQWRPRRRPKPSRIATWRRYNRASPGSGDHHSVGRCGRDACVVKSQTQLLTTFCSAIAEAARSIALTLRWCAKPRAGKAEKAAATLRSRVIAAKAPATERRSRKAAATHKSQEIAATTPATERGGRRRR